MTVKTLANIFVPITAGGGIREIKDVERLLKNGADKVFVNTGAVKNPKLITDLVKEFGSQSIVSSIEAKKISEKKWEVYTENGREKTNLDLEDWLLEVVDRGAGEIILTSIDNDGTKKGLDLELFQKINESISNTESPNHHIPSRHLPFPFPLHAAPHLRSHNSRPPRKGSPGV